MKRMLSLLLAVVMLMSLAPLALAREILATASNNNPEIKSTVNAAETTLIDSIVIYGLNYPPAAEAQTKDYLNYIVTSDYHYTVTTIGWYDVTNESEMQPTDVFEVEGTYALGLTLSADDGYLFSSDATISLNADHVPYDSTNTAIGYLHNEYYVWTEPFTITEAPAKTIESVEITNLQYPPVIGMTEDDMDTFSYVDNSLFTVVKSGWFDDTAGDWMPDTDEFSADHSYAFGIQLSAAEGYVFDEDKTAVTINGGTEIFDFSVISSGGTSILIWTKVATPVDEQPVQYITEVSVTDVNFPPVAGAKCEDYMTASIPEDAHYSIKEYGWISINEGKLLEADDEFKAGNTYVFGMQLIADEGYEFTENTTASINGGEIELYYLTGIDSKNPMLYYVYAPLYTVPAEQPVQYIEEVAVTGVVYPPVAGAKCEDYLKASVPEGVHYTINDIAWKSLTDGTMLDKDDTFVAGNTYIFGVQLKADEGYEFSENATVTINGGAIETYMMTGVHPTDNTLYNVFAAICTVTEAAPVQYIDEVAVTGVDYPPTAGAKCGDYLKASIPEDVHYTIKDIGWMSLTEGKVLDKDDTFKPGHAYVFGVQLKADEGYEFSENTIATLNSGEIELYYMTGVHPTNNTLYNVFAAIYTVPDGEPSTVIGDLNGDGKVNTADAVIVLKYAAEMITLDDNQLTAGDCNRDGKVNTADAVLILKYAAEMITEF